MNRDVIWHVSFISNFDSVSNYKVVAVHLINVSMIVIRKGNHFMAQSRRNEILMYA